MTIDTIAASTVALPRAPRIGSTPVKTSVPLSKSASVIKLLLRAKGASSLELISATDWQAHSVRAFLSGLRKKGRVLVREARKSGEVAYRIEAAIKAAPEGTATAASSPTPVVSA